MVEMICCGPILPRKHVIGAGKTLDDVLKERMNTEAGRIQNDFSKGECLEEAALKFYKWIEEKFPAERGVRASQIWRHPAGFEDLCKRQQI